MTTPTGRFAPTPSGALHFGSLVAALASYCEARSRRGRWLLRIEDVDTPRVVAGAGDQILRDLETFGFDWDGEVLYQSSRFEEYRHYLDKLLRQGDAYACECSRRSLREQGVPSGPLGQIYPGNCRNKGLSETGHSIRLLTASAGNIRFNDLVYGDFGLDLPGEVGDFVLRRSDNIYAYHLAVVVDDEIQGIDHIVRGADLLENTSLHLYLQQRLGFSSPQYMHLPLVMNADGVKLAKQTGASPLDHRQASSLLVAAMDHLAQATVEGLADNEPKTILRWACDNWDPSRIAATGALNKQPGVE